MSARPAARLRGLSAYQAQDVPSPGLLRLDGSAGTRPIVRLDSPEFGAASVQEYPDPGRLTEDLAALWDVPAERVVIGAGADELLDRCCRAYLESGRTLLLPVPAFAMIPHYARLAEATIREIPWPKERFPREDVLSAIDDGTGMIAIVSPNNPTGAVATAEDLEQLSAAAPHAIVVLDHAYVEYAGDADLTRAAVALPNVVVVRTFSKAWGLAGARVGWAIAPADTADALRAAGGPYPVAGLSLAIARARLRDNRGDVADHAAVVGRNRAVIRQRFTDAGIPCPDSRANFVYADARKRAPFLASALLTQGILVRTFARDPEAVRIAVQDDDLSLSRLLDALDLSLSPDALLLDLDGVLADVTESQRACIRETAESFGVSVRPEDVSATILAGQANDDWEVTHRLVERGGVATTFAQVRERYQERYLGRDGTAGLRENERCLVEPDRLRRLAARVPLAVVTGRPRDEAKWFLRTRGIADCFSALITADDAPRKPDPAPVKRAMESLGVRRAWMIGDTPDDVTAARAAGALPVGVVSPADEPTLARERLRAAGAAFILEDWEDLERWIR